MTFPFPVASVVAASAASAFPVVQATNGAIQASATTSHAITMPSGVQVGDIVIVALSVNSAADITVGSGTGWSNPFVLNNANISAALFWKIADGSDTLTLTTSASLTSTHITYRISGGATLLISASGVVTTTNPDPLVLHPLLGLQKYLWLAIVFNEDGTQCTAAPSNYTNLITQDGAVTNTATQGAQRDLEASYEDPGTFTNAGINRHIVLTLAIAPSATPVGTVMPRVIAAGTLAASTGAPTVNLPAGWAENDILIIVAETANQSISTPSGWTEVTNSPQGTGTAGDIAASRLTAFWRRATSSESNVALADAGDHTIAVMCAVRGCPTSGDPFDATDGSAAASGTSLSFPAVTTTGATRLIINAGVHGEDGTSAGRFSAWANASLLPVIEFSDASNTAGNGGGVGMAYGGKDAAGSTGNTTATLAADVPHALFTMALKPA